MAGNAKYRLFLVVVCSIISKVYGQNNTSDLPWDKLIYSQPAEWYASEEAQFIAENVLLYQRNSGGWPKNIEMHLPLTNKRKKELQNLKSKETGATIDNSATIQELDFLSKIYAKTFCDKYKSAFLKGIDYLFEAQYENGGWPQFYPLEEGDYSTHITYNDNAMVNVMNVMKAIFEENNRFSISFDEETVQRAKMAFNKGLEVILKTQYKQNGTLTVWCAQHDENTLLPSKARSYELPSLSGSESADIVLMLMKIDNPSQEIITAVQSAVKWFDNVKITGIRIEKFKDSEGLKDYRVVMDENAPPLWARFYELENNRPFFCDRDGIKKYSLAEISQERREGYSWYDGDPKAVFKQYSLWQPKWDPSNNVMNK